MSEAPAPDRPPNPIGAALFALVLGGGWGSAAGGLLAAAELDEAIATVIGMVTGIALLLFLAPSRRRRERRLAAELLVLVVLPFWGFIINMSLTKCAELADNRLLSHPEIDGLYAGYGFTVCGYAVSRARPEMLGRRGEPFLFSTLGLGVALMVPVVLQFNLLAILGLVFAPVGLPLVAPLAVIALYAVEIVMRMRRRGAEEVARGRAARVGVFLGSPLLLGLYAVAQALWLRDPAGAWRVFAHTCNDTLFGQLVPPPSSGDHYLCTVAARGHPWLVRPERTGVRRGRAIVVNRQLAVANAFEDLLHERWPRLGRAARRTYDRLGLPVARLIRRRWVADAIWIAMKPAEWTFVVALLLLDREPPEARVARMYT